jgi:hypothetical protein
METAMTKRLAPWIALAVLIVCTVVMIVFVFSDHRGIESLKRKLHEIVPGSTGLPYTRGVPVDYADIVRGCTGPDGVVGASCIEAEVDRRLGVAHPPLDKPSMWPWPQTTPKAGPDEFALDHTSYLGKRSGSPLQIG